MRALVKPEWKGKDAFVIGGGSSLRTFDFEWLRGRHTLGVNDAFRAGPARCSRVIFADGKFWKVVKWELEEYAKAGGTVYSVSPDTERFNIPWVHQFKRGGNGLSKEPGVLGWNHNTGASALNLALLLGAQRIFLLGFDMTDIRGSTHWHNQRPVPTPPESFARFQHGFGHVVAHLSSFKGREVFNVTDGVSKLEGFQKIALKKMEALCR